MPLARRLALLLIAALLLPARPGRAEEIREDEPLVMRLIFEDCLGFVRHGRAPFEGLATRPVSAGPAEGLPAPLRARGRIVELLSSRYVAVWGIVEDERVCMVQTAAAARRDPALLGVRREGFVARVTARAVAEGITKRSPEDAFSPVITNSWSVPEPRGGKQPLRFALIATAESPDGRLADVGIIVVAGPAPRGR